MRYRITIDDTYGPNDKTYDECWSCNSEITNSTRPFCSDECEDKYICSMDGDDLN